MADNDERERWSRNVVLFPFMAQGHIIPFIALPHQLQQTHNCTITFVTTKLNIPKISSSLISPYNNNIRIFAIPFCSTDHGLPPDVENTDALPYHLISTFIESCFSLKPHFRNLISDLMISNGPDRPLCIIADIFFGWSHDIARECGLFHALFCSGGAYGFGCFHSLWLNLPHKKMKTIINMDDTNISDEIKIPDFPEASRIHLTQMSENLRVADRRDKFLVVMQKLLSQWETAGSILFNTVEELEAKTGLLYFRRKLGRPVWPIGPVVLPVLRKEDGTKSESEITCTKWLDSKPASSVLYVSFGSQNTISPSQMMDLAMALESSGKNFIWVVRPPIGFNINGEFRADEWLPKGFEERVIRESNRGLLVHRWAPQIDILSHEAVSAFLSHCGWNSVLESLSHGVPIIGWPLAAEQFYNAKFLEEELGVCVEVARGKSSRVGLEETVKKIELVMSVGTGNGSDQIRRNVLEVRDIMRNALKDENGFKGSSVNAMDELLNAASLMRQKHSV